MALGLLGLAGPLFFHLQLTHDAAWQMWVGRQLLHGADLYSGIIEINPPLWFWLAEGLAAVGEPLGFTGLGVLVAFFLAIIAASLLLADRVMEGWGQWQRALLLTAFVVAALPPGNFGQREHFTFIACVPYVLLIGRRALGSPVPTPVAVAVGVLAATGFALKPHFALIPILLELWLRRPLVRPETVTVALLAVIYGLSIVLIEPDFFTKAVPLAQHAYGQFGGFHPPQLLPAALPLPFALLARPDRNAYAAALLVAALAFTLIFVVQLKGFAYQALPGMGMLVLAVAASIRESSSIQRAAALGAAILAITVNLTPYRTPAWADVPPGSSYAALSVAPRAGWPLVEDRGLNWPLRAMSLWMAPALGDEVREWAVRDLQCNPPTYLLVDDRQVNFTGIFPDILRHYVPLWRRERLTLMKIARPMSRPANCRSFTPASTSALR